MITREQAWELLRKYNKEPFHLHHSVTVEGVMRYYAGKKGYDQEFWGLCGLLHDIDFEMWPEEHCIKAPELLAEIDAPEELVREMNHLIPFKKYDLVSLGAADQPIELPIHKILPPGEVITLTCPQLGRLEIAVEDNRDPNTVMRGWSPRPYFLETN